MALLFQANPDQWDLREKLIPGQMVRYFVTRYRNLIGKGALVLLWSAQGRTTRSNLAVSGLYGWGITSDDVREQEGRYRIPLQYVERWITASDNDDKVPPAEQSAPIPATEVLTLSTWQDHLLNLVRVGSNFLMTDEQMDQLWQELVAGRIANSQLGAAIDAERNNPPLNPQQFPVSPAPLVKR